MTVHRLRTTAASDPGLRFRVVHGYRRAFRIVGTGPPLVLIHGIGDSVVDALPDGTARAAFIRTLRAVVDWRGQVVTMLDRCYLTRAMPTLLVWGGRDAIVPVAHAHRAQAAMPGSRLEVFDEAGHFPVPHRPAPVRRGG